MSTNDSKALIPQGSGTLSRIKPRRTNPMVVGMVVHAVIPLGTDGIGHSSTSGSIPIRRNLSAKRCCFARSCSKVA